MSFKINWPDFGPEFISSAKAQLTTALNSGLAPESIAGSIDVLDLKMGRKPPDLEILEISELLADRFKGIFKFVYNGDAQILLHTHVQANPLTTKPPFRHLPAANVISLASEPLIVPMDLSISQLSLRGIIVLVVDKSRGITLVFKNDPLESVLVSSTFDKIPNIRKLLQNQIETQLRNLFQEELPMIIHRLSLLTIEKSNQGQDQEHQFAADKTNETKVPNQYVPQTYIPHSKKWKSNPKIHNYSTYPTSSGYNSTDEEDFEGFILTRSLSATLLNQHEDMGLHRILESRNSVLASSRREKKTKQFTGYQVSSGNRSVGLQSNGRETASCVPDALLDNSNFDEMSYVGRVQNFLEHAYSFAKPLDEYQTFSATDPSNYSDQRYLGPYYQISSPSAVHKGVIADGMHWSRPNVEDGPATSHRIVNNRAPRQAPAISRLDSHGEEYFQRQLPSSKRVVLEVGSNETTAHLANLLRVHLTISPNTSVLSHFVFRGSISQSTTIQSQRVLQSSFRTDLNSEMETRSLPESFATTVGGQRRRVLKRRVHVVKLPKSVLRSIPIAKSTTIDESQEPKSASEK